MWLRVWSAGIEKNIRNEEFAKKRKMAFRLLNWMNWIFWLGTLALILIAVTSCTEEKRVNADIE